jgi:hypothetical protein
MLAGHEHRSYDVCGGCAAALRAIGHAMLENPLKFNYALVCWIIVESYFATIRSMVYHVQLPNIEVPCYSYLHSREINSQVAHRYSVVNACPLSVNILV